VAGRWSTVAASVGEEPRCEAAGRGGVNPSAANWGGGTFLYGGRAGVWANGKVTPTSLSRFGQSYVQYGAQSAGASEIGKSGATAAGASTWPI
jgi:hypothetical protein